MDKRYFAAADVGGTKIALGIFDEEKQPVAKVKLPTDTSISAEALFTGMVETLKGMMAEKGLAPACLAGVGVGVPAPVRAADGVVAMCSMLPSISHFPLRRFLSELLPGVKTEVGNDGHCAALAESRHGAGRGFPHMLYCPVSTGFSSAIIIDGKLFRGSDGFAGESGHSIVAPGTGLPCGCGNRGCPNGLAAGGSIVRYIRNWIAEGETTLMLTLADGSPEKIDARILDEAARAGDEMALRALKQMSDTMGLWLFNLYKTLNINCYVFGGGLINMGDLLFAPVRKVFDEYRHAGESDEPVYFKFAELGQDSGLLGALELLF